MTFTRISIFVVALVAIASTIVHAQTIPPECETLGFCTHQISSSARGASSVFASDLDGDGDIDILSASRRIIAWYENTDGQGTYGTKKIISRTVIKADSVFAADLDGDGDNDVISASFDDNEFTWYENTDGLGTFRSRQNFSTNIDSNKTIFTSDLDGDGDLDILISFDNYKIVNGIIWYENIDGQGTFRRKQIINTNASGARSVFAADLDGDGDNDVLSALSIDEIAWYENTDGLGSFGPQQSITTNVIQASSVFAADLDDDGDFDVLSASRADKKIAWYENTDGMGTFGPQQIISTAAFGAVSVFSSDIDGDGDYDVLSAADLDNEIAWYENVDGQGTFGVQQIISKSVDGASSVFAADLDGDGDVDVLSASERDDKIAWYENTDGVGTFGLQQLVTNNTDVATSVFVIDLDGDGDIDVLSSSRLDDKIAWFENTDGLGTFGVQQIITIFADGAFSVFAADLDGDGDNDALSASGIDNKIAWYENLNGLGSFGPQRIISTSTVGARSVFASDLDGDGDTDVLSASSRDDKIAWYENTDGLGTFGPQQIITTDAIFASSVFAADLDGDGDQDVLSASFRDDKIAWYENTDGLGTFGLQQIITIDANGAKSVYAADLDGDGDKDVLSASEAFNLDKQFLESKIAWYENTDGLGSFGSQQIITTNAFGANSVFAVDLDGDLDFDVLSSSSLDNKIAWYENTDSQGSFGPMQVITASANFAAFVITADLDGDGDQDVLSASVSDDKIAWYENECDCNLNGFNDRCDIASGRSSDCNKNFILDECDVDDETSEDCNGNIIPDECEPDCNSNGIQDECEECCDDSECDDSDQCTADLCINGVCNYHNNKLCGACCDRIDGICIDNLIRKNCTFGQPTWTRGATCQSIICDQAIGTCCNTRFGTCTNNLIFAECQGQNLSWTKGEDCNALNCPDPFIPAVSQWGLAVMTLLLLIGAKMYYGFPVVVGSKRGSQIR